MLRRTHLLTLILVCAVVALVAIPSLTRILRQRQFDVAQEKVRSHGGQLSFDLVDGNYMLSLSGDAASKETIETLLPTLKTLPTGFTLIGPGESRQFWINLEGESITDSGLDSLCALEVSWVSVTGGSITDKSAARLSSVNPLDGIRLNNVTLSETAVAALRASKPHATVEVNGISH